MTPRELIPFREFVIETTWPAHVVVAELQKQIEPRRLFNRGSSPFVGKASADGRTFRFHRRPRGFERNSNAAIVRATVEAVTPERARIRVRVRLHLFVLVFMIVWMSAATFAALAGIVVALARGRVVGLVAVAFPVFGMAFTSFMFVADADKAEELLRSLFPSPPGTIVEQGPFR